jgi:hypothetical protein
MVRAVVPMPLYSLYYMAKLLSQACLASTGIKSSTCINHIFTNAAEMCLKAVSKSIGCVVIIIY